VLCAVARERDASPLGSITALRRSAPRFQAQTARYPASCLRAILLVSRARERNHHATNHQETSIEQRLSDDPADTVSAGKCRFATPQKDCEFHACARLPHTKGVRDAKCHAFRIRSYNENKRIVTSESCLLI
jgi:hypothetical protein